MRAGRVFVQWSFVSAPADTGVSPQSRTCDTISFVLRVSQLKCLKIQRGVVKNLGNLPRPRALCLKNGFSGLICFKHRIECAAITWE